MKLRILLKWMLSAYFGVLTFGCSPSGGTSHPATVSVDPTITSSNTYIPIETNSPFTSTRVIWVTPPPSPESVATQKSTFTPVTNFAPSPIPTKALLPIPFPIGDTLNYMLLGSDRLWHPEQIRASQDLEDMVFSLQPWSADGRQLVTFLRTEDSVAKRALALLTLETGELTFLENAQFVSSRFLSSNAQFWPPIWSPDGQYLLYAISTEEDQYFYQIAIYDLLVQEEVFLSPPLRLISLSGWSFDSQQIAYIRWSDPLTEAESKPVLEIMDISSYTIEQLEQSTALSYEMAHWSPTSKRLVLYIGGVSWHDPLTTYAYDEIYLVDSQSRSFEQLKGPSTREDEYYESDNPAYFVHGTPWALDGKSIIYSDRGLLCSLEIVSQQETCFIALDEQLIQLGAVGVEYPGWSPNGEWVGFVMKLDSVFCSPVAVIKPDGSDLRFTSLETGDCSLFGPVWSPIK